MSPRRGSTPRRTRLTDRQSQCDSDSDSDSDCNCSCYHVYGKRTSILLRRSSTREQQAYSSSDRLLARNLPTAPLSPASTSSAPARIGRLPSRCPPKPASDRRKDLSSISSHSPNRRDLSRTSPHSPSAAARIALPTRPQPLPDKSVCGGRGSPTFSDVQILPFSGPSISSVQLTDGQLL
jgi:hypothetical protein